MPQPERKIYVKDHSFDPIFKTINTNFYFKSRMLPGILLALGFLVLATQVIYPLVYIKTHDEVTPEVKSTVLARASGFSEFEFRELNSTNDIQAATEVIPEFFSIDIPKLNIYAAQIETNSPTLNPDKALGHYTGSALPGHVGNSFIYGHSVLPWFFNPKNYKTIFSTLGNLKTGDEIFVYYNAEKLSYKVESIELLATTDVQPLAEYKPQYLNESTITLMTCWPAGTKSKRLLVKAVMEIPKE